MSFIELRREAQKRRRSRKRMQLARFAHKLAQFPSVVWSKPWGGIERYEPAPDYRAARTVYPYSVVAGGVLSERELETFMAKDPVVERHYRDILPARLHPTRLNAAVNVYASYRLANSVHWMTHTIRVPKGELILSDGANLIRARCGNRLIFAPPPPEQATSILPDGPNPPVPGMPPIEPPELVFDYGMPAILAPPGSMAPPHLERTPPTEVAHFWPPAVAPPTWCCGLGGFPGNWRPSRPEQPEPPAAIAEPTTSLLLGSGCFVMLIRMARRTSG